MKRRFEHWLEGYMEYTKHSEAPDKFHKWAGIATVASALRRRVWLDMGYFQWTPNFFIFFVAPPGIVSKSTTASLGMDLLREVDGIHFGPSVVTWQALVVAMTEAQESFLLPNGEYYDQAAITIVASELGTFLDPRNREQLDVLTDLWDGKQGVWEKVTKTGTSERIVNPWISVVGCTTPSWIAENFGDYFVGGGLASRSIMIYADKKRRLVAYPQRSMPANFQKLKNALIHDLTLIADLVGEYTITPEAYEWGEAWYKDHYTKEHSHIEGEKFAGYLARKQTHIHKLAMVLSAMQRDDLTITVKELEQADREITVLEKDMPLVYGKMNRESEMIMAADILSYLRGLSDDITKQRLYREFFTIMSMDTFDKIMKSLYGTGLVRSVQKGGNYMIYAVKEEPKK